MAKIVFGVTGSVAAVKVPELIRELIRRGHDIECVMSKAAQGLITPDLLHWASGVPVICSITGGIEHVRLLGEQGEADLLVICPATSNTISKIASGIDDTSVTTMAATALGSSTKIIIVPAMHVSMYNNPYVKANIEALKSAGVIIVDPRIEEQKAKIADDEQIILAIESIL